MTSLVAGPASRCAGAGNRVGRDRTSGRAESNGMCGRRSRGRPPEFPNIKERLLAVASDLFYRCGVRGGFRRRNRQGRRRATKSILSKLFFAIHLLH